MRADWMAAVMPPEVPPYTTTSYEAVAPRVVTTATSTRDKRQRVSICDDRDDFPAGDQPIETTTSDAFEHGAARAMNAVVARLRTFLSPQIFARPPSFW
jgi:hypothetical protein